MSISDPASDPGRPWSAAEAPPLPHQLFLLSYDPARARLDDDSAAVRGSLLRAAAIAELRIAGLLRDRDGRAERTSATVTTPLHPFLAEVLDDVPQDRPRRWFGVLERRWYQAEGTVRDQLAAAGVVRVERRRILGLIPTRRIEVPDPGPVRALRASVREVVRAGADPAAVPLQEALLAVLAIDGDVSTMFGWRELRAHKPAVRALAQRIDRELTGLRPALFASIAARRASG
ncbi:GOLPH3/VPS74 family protein [Pseudonocardia alaniniphila]|uniref:GPP34 family phosphoprotein n=1 Tax=Pseudonocardia alaniniphila TaxID=75291 RepID=A0ABS9TTF9_9PSEU|nr:GPP34 family phosphoprotein [Pseudonocardia alaniniphila]MCH6171814.1 GPP34 family phosphoprotein [Pseudonocardia alaniniphila]